MLIGAPSRKGDKGLVARGGLTAVPAPVGCLPGATWFGACESDTCYVAAATELRRKRSGKGQGRRGD
jgi:hypothetical protein